MCLHRGLCIYHNIINKWSIPITSVKEYREHPYRYHTAPDRCQLMGWAKLIAERTRAGLAAASEQGSIGGRRRVMTPEVVDRAHRMLENGATRQQVADVIGVDVKTIYKYLPAT